MLTAGLKPRGIAATGAHPQPSVQLDQVHRVHQRSQDAAVVPRTVAVVVRDLDEELTARIFDSASTVRVPDRWAAPSRE